MKNVILTGATGMIGGLILNTCLDHSEINKVTSFVRRPSGIKHPKLEEVIHKDFKDYSGLEDHFKGQDIAYFCVGVYTGAVDREKFREITVDYTQSFADTLKKHSPEASFCFLSGQGADRTEKSRMMFAKDKGIAENYLLRLKFGATHIFRPAYIYPVQPRKEPNFSYRMMRFLYPLMKSIYPSGVITSEQLAQAMFVAGLYGTEKTTLENEDIKKVVV